MKENETEKKREGGPLFPLPNERRIDEAIAAKKRDKSLNSPRTKFEAPDPWPDSKDEKGEKKG